MVRGDACNEDCSDVCSLQSSSTDIPSPDASSLAGSSSSLDDLLSLDDLEVNCNGTTHDTRMSILPYSRKFSRVQSILWFM